VPPISGSKATCPGWPLFSAPFHSFVSAVAEILEFRLTQEIHIPRFESLITHWLVGIFSKTLIAAGRGGSKRCRVYRRMNNSPGKRGAVRQSRRFAQSKPNWRLGKPVLNFQDLRNMNMTKSERTWAALLPSGHKKPELGVWLSLPRGKKVDKSRREIEYSRRCSHGIARAIEGLRRVRMSVVPRPNY
jgi:hypothetical protein